MCPGGSAGSRSSRVVSDSGQVRVLRDEVVRFRLGRDGRTFGKEGGRGNLGSRDGNAL
jgi:hypothetical protein